ncbi:MAG: replicative DNA helicase, partial [Christensenellaceae bacterium]|nr:replicative DNA helicase [Christensenellaceae bacterium]
FLHRDDYFGQGEGEEAAEPKSRIIIAKQRSGPTGSIQVKWRGEMTKYVEVDFIHEEE